MTPAPRCWTVLPKDARARLDQYLAREIPGQSRSRIQTWIRQGLVRVNGGTVKTGRTLRTGEEITLEPPPVSPPGPEAEPIPLAILYEDEDIVIVDKPAGLIVHAGAGVRSGTLVNALLHRFGKLEAGDPQRPGIVHRLDRGTSGVMVVARNDQAHRALAASFKNRQVRKEYVALVHGRPRPDHGTIRVPLGRDTRQRTRISTRSRKRREAVTHYCLQETCGPFSLLKVVIETGRTHQIRVHLAHAGHPIVGDRLYGGRRFQDMPASLAGAVAALNRPFLHARRLEFLHPGTLKPVAFESPLPGELLEFLSRAASS